MMHGTTQCPYCTVLCASGAEESGTVPVLYRYIGVVRG